MDYKEMLEEDEKVLSVSKVHKHIVVMPIVFVSVFAAIIIGGSTISGDFIVFCYIISAALLCYPVIILLLIKNSRFVITDKRVMHQNGVFVKRVRPIDLKDIVNISFYQTGRGKKLKCGDVMLEVRSDERDNFFRVFRFLSGPHEFIVTLKDTMDKLDTP